MTTETTAKATTEAEEVVAAKVGCGQCVGAAAGLGLGIWACVTAVKPALANVKTISNAGADWITAAIALLGGLEVTTLAGMLAGGVLCCLGICVTSSCRTASTARKSPSLDLDAVLIADGSSRAMRM